MDLNVYGAWGNLGFGNVTRNISRSLSDLSYNIAGHTVGGSVHADDKEEEQFLKDVFLRGQTNFPLNSPTIKIWHPSSASLTITRPYLFFTMFELNRLTEVEKHHLKHPDYLISPSKWSQEIILRETGRKSLVVPLGINPNIFYPKEVKQTNNTYNFITMGKYEKRKNHHLIPDLFAKAFTKKDDVALNVLCSNPFYTQQKIQNWENLYKNSPLGEKIFILPHLQTQYQVADLLRSIDCGLYISSGEGWNLPLLETISCNKPVITTNYSGHTEFCTEENSLCINDDEDELELADDAVEGVMGRKWFDPNNGGEWLKITPSMEERAIEHMRYCFKERLNTNEAGIATGKKYTWLNSARSLVKILEEIGE